MIAPGQTNQVATTAFKPYGEPFGPGDEITCFVDLTSNPGELFFAKNGTLLGAAFKVVKPMGNTREALIRTAIFPHVLLKNLAVSVDFKGPGAPYNPCINGYYPWAVSGPPTPWALGFSVERGFSGGYLYSLDPSPRPLYLYPLD